MSTPLDGTAGGLIKTGGAALLASLVRTAVPWAVGFVVAALTKLGVPADEADVLNLVNGVVSGLIALGYYLLVRLLEVFASSKFGWLLGFAKAPVYAPNKAVAAAPTDTVAVTRLGEPPAYGA